jgi:hypothetical protein
MSSVSWSAKDIRLNSRSKMDADVLGISIQHMLSNNSTNRPHLYRCASSSMQPMQSIMFLQTLKTKCTVVFHPLQQQHDIWHLENGKWYCCHSQKKVKYCFIRQHSWRLIAIELARNNSSIHWQLCQFYSARATSNHCWVSFKQGSFVFAPVLKLF